MQILIKTEKCVLFLKDVSATVLHPLNNQDRLLDDSNSEVNYRNSRSSLMNFAPTTSLAENQHIRKIMPELEGKTICSGIKVPVPCVGGVDCTVK